MTFESKKHLSLISFLSVELIGLSLRLEYGESHFFSIFFEARGLLLALEFKSAHQSARSGQGLAMNMVIEGGV